MGELGEVAERAVARIDVVVIGDVVAVVAAGRRLERHQPDRRDAEALQVIEPSHQALEIADAVAVRIHESADGQAIDDRVLVPEVVDHALWTRSSLRCGWRPRRHIGWRGDGSSVSCDARNRQRETGLQAASSSFDSEAALHGRAAPSSSRTSA